MMMMKRVRGVVDEDVLSTLEGVGDDVIDVGCQDVPCVMTPWKEKEKKETWRVEFER